MDSITRRRFLIASGVAGAASLAAGATWYSFDSLLETAADAPKDASRLVIITLYGGNDSLNTVIPFHDDAYYSLRPELAYGKDEVLKLDEKTGLNPALKGIHRYFSDKKVAIVQGVGYPKPDRSHFRSMDIWQTADPVRPIPTGWIGRWLDHAGGDSLLAVSFERVLPPLLAGTTSAGAVIGLKQQQLPASFTMDLLTELGKKSSGGTELQTWAASSLADLPRIDQQMNQVRQRMANLAASGQPAAATATGGSSGLESQLKLVSQSIQANVATRVFSVSLGGFDTHADEKAPHRALLAILDRGVTAFLDGLSALETAPKVTVLIYSEFGRRVRANASDGTDHGTASDVMIMGHGVKGGLYGAPSSLADLDDGDLKYTTDFRDVYASVVENVLESDAENSVPGWKGRLPQLWQPNG